MFDIDEGIRNININNSNESYEQLKKEREIYRDKFLKDISNLSVENLVNGLIDAKNFRWYRVNWNDYRWYIIEDEEKNGKTVANRVLDVSENMLFLPGEDIELKEVVATIENELIREEVACRDKGNDGSISALCGSLKEKIDEFRKRASNFTEVGSVGGIIIWGIVAVVFVAGIIGLFVNPTMSGWFHAGQSNFIWTIVTLIIAIIGLVGTGSFLIAGVIFIVVCAIGFFLNKIFPIYMILKLLIVLILAICAFAAGGAAGQHYSTLGNARRLKRKAEEEELQKEIDLYKKYIETLKRHSLLMGKPGSKIAYLYYSFALDEIHKIEGNFKMLGK